MTADQHEDETNEKSASDDVTFDRAMDGNDESEEEDSDDDETIDAVCLTMNC